VVRGEDEEDVSVKTVCFFLVYELLEMTVCTVDDISCIVTVALMLESFLFLTE